MTTFKKTLGLKISIPIIITTTIFILSIIILNNKIFENYAEKEIDAKISNEVNNIQTIIKRVKRKAMWTSATCSELAIVEKAYKTYYQTGNIQTSSKIIESEIAAITKAISNFTKQKPNISFHLPPAKVFFRSWSPKRGDDISGFRKTVLKISETQKPMGGIEVGRNGLVIRALAPIFDDNKKYLGSVETVTPLTEVLKNAKMTDRERFAFFMHSDLLSIATKFKESIEKNGAKLIKVGDFVLANKLTDGFEINNLSEEKLNQALSKIVYFSVDTLKYAIFPIYSFNKKAESIGVIQYDISNMKSTIKTTTSVNLLIGIVLIILIVILIIVLTNIYIRKPLDRAVGAIRKISNNEINFQIEEYREDEIGELFNSVNEINKNFKKILSTIKDTADGVLSAGNELSTASQLLSERASEQSSTTEEIAASMEQMLAIISSNTEKAEYTGKISAKSAKETENSNTVLQETINSVSKISDKITIISEIAGKTDILSINAAIEASRAGDSGKGFAVVATEIRKLADKTKKVSEEIDNLSRRGQDISKLAGEKLTNLIPEIIESAKLVKNIVVASREQQDGVVAINSSIQQLTQISNENSASAEEMSSSAEELSSQAQQLKELISIFKI